MTYCILGPWEDKNITIFIGKYEIVVPMKLLLKIPFLFVLFINTDNSHKILLPPVKPYYIKEKIDGFLEVLQFCSDPANYTFPPDYGIMIETLILADFLCIPTLIRFVETRLQVPLGSIEPSEIGFQKLRQIIRGSYRVYNDHFVEYQRLFCHKCGIRILLPDPPQRIFRTICCNKELCVKCGTDNFCPECRRYTTPSYPNKLEERFFSTNTTYHSLEETYFPYLFP